MRAAAYTRVSTEEQVREGVSLDAQETRLRAYCVAKDWDLVALERDEGRSAKTLERPGMARILALIESRQVEVLLIFKLDRLTRSVADLAQLLLVFARYGVVLVSLQESLDQTTATGELMMNLLISVSQWERKVIGERTRFAMDFLRSSQRPYCSAVYGYKRDGDVLVVDVEETATIRRMRDLHQRGLSYAGVAQQLNIEGVPTSLGRAWSRKTVWRIVHGTAAG